MNNLTSMLCLGFLLFGLQGISQNSSLTELLERLDENHMGSITDVFTTEEIVLLRAHFDAKNDAEEPFQQEDFGLWLYSPENQNGNFGNFDNGNPGTYNILGASGAADFDGAGAYNPVTDRYHAIDNAGNAYMVNPDTGVYSFLGVVTPPTGESYTGLEFDPTDNTLYGLSTDGAGSTSLTTIDPITLNVSFKGNTGLTLGIALAMDLSGDAYAYDIDDDSMYRINITNGNATLLGSIGFNASFGQGLTLARSTGNLYMSAFNATSFRSELRMVNTTTGNTTLQGPIGDMSPGGLLQFAWTGVRDMVLGNPDTSFESFNYYPNPVRDRLTIQATSSIDRFEIYNLLGQQLMSKDIDALSANLDVSFLPSGYYIMTVAINGETASYKIVKR